MIEKIVAKNGTILNKFIKKTEGNKRPTIPTSNASTIVRPIKIPPIPLVGLVMTPQDAKVAEGSNTKKQKIERTKNSFCQGSVTNRNR